MLRPPLTSIQSEGYSTPDVEVAVATMQGKRPKQEDRYKINPYRGFYGVFDGHGGHECADYVQQHIPDLICPHPQPQNPLARDLFDVNNKEWEEQLHTSIKSACLQLDYDIVREKKITSGSTAVFIKHDSVHNLVTVGNIGDSRFLWMTSTAYSQPLKDHKPNDPEEEARIKKAGSAVIFGRVGGNLAVSRAFGDSYFKYATPFTGYGNEKDDIKLFKSLEDQPISPMPDVASFKMDKTKEEDSVDNDDAKLGLLFSDGLTESLTNEQIVDTVRTWKQLEYPDRSWSQLKSKHLAECSKFVIQEAFHKGSTDNMTLMMIYFRQGQSMMTQSMGTKRKTLHSLYCSTGVKYRHWTEYTVPSVTSNHFDFLWSEALDNDIKRYVDSRDVPIISPPSPQSEQRAEGFPSTPVLEEEEIESNTTTNFTLILPSPPPLQTIIKDEPNDDSS